MICPCSTARADITYPRMHEFNQSLKYDQRMHEADIRGSIAYAKSLTLVGILSKEEEVKITEGLQAVGKEWKEGVVRHNAPLYLPLLPVLRESLPHPWNLCSSSSIQTMRTSTPRTSVG